MTVDRAEVPPLYAITDPSRGTHLQLALELAAAGVRWIQIREKSAKDSRLLQELQDIVNGSPEGVAVLVNDRVDLALASGAAGVHLGDEDLSPLLARRAASSRPLLIGYSTHSLEELRAAAADPAVDYVALGPIFESATKNVRAPLGLEVIRRARDLTTKPLVAIGGIDRSNIAQVLRAGADSAAVIAALYGGGKIRENVRALAQEAVRFR